MKKIGLDASTTTVGYAFVDNKTVIDMGFIPINKEKTIRHKVNVTLDAIIELCPFEDVDKIYIEDNLSGFAGGRTSQQVIIKLAKFNAILCYILEEEFQVEVQNINPMTVRKNVFGKARVKGIKAKDFVKRQVEEMYDTKKWCKETSRGNWDKRNIDMYDGLVMSLYEEKA